MRCSPPRVGALRLRVEPRLGDGDEVLVRSPAVMRGYWNRPEETGRVVDADGWLHTGDIARLEANHLTITGRIKDILVLSNAEKVSPVDLELAITGDPLFEQAMVVGEGRPYLCALLVLDLGAWAQLCADLGLGSAPATESALAVKAVLDRVAVRLESLPAYARVRKAWLTLEPWTVEDGLVTPTMKLKRDAIAARFRERIEALYREAD